MRSIDSKFHSQQGVALLFALGILSLMLVTGVSFLANALMTQKIVVNNQEAASAKSLTQLALGRAMAHLNTFNLLQVQRSALYYASDASSVYSRTNSAAFAEADGLTIRHDQLYGPGSLLSVKRGGHGGPAWFNNSGEESKAQWIYVHENGTSSDGNSSSTSPIIGRYAYQVLPQSSNSRLSLFAVTAGGLEGGIAKIGSAGNETYTRIPQKHRWGVDVDELNIGGLDRMFDHYWKNGSSELCDPLYTFDSFISLLSGYKSLGGSSYLKPFFSDDVQTENRKRWLEHIFVEGRGRVAREAYSDGASIPRWYPRFNLSEHPFYYDADKNLKTKVFDSTARGTWYHRFIAIPSSADEEKSRIDAIANSNEVIERLTAVPDSDGGRYSDTFLVDRHDEIGLPFLRRIGSDDQKGGFLKIADLRKQIAANLNDYCDSDSIPTSDVPAKDWASKVGAASELPTYTGNEKTPYINEIALGFQLTDAQFDNGKFTGKVDAEVLAELIKIYDTVPEIQNFKLHGFFKHLALSFEVTFKGTATVTFTNEDNTSSSSTVTIDSMSNKSGEDAYDGEVKFDSTLLKEFEINFNNKVAGSGPYWVKNWQSTAAQQASVSIDFSNKIKELVPDLGSKSVTNIAVNPSSITVKLAKVSFDIMNLALMMNDTSVTPASDYGVDFVKLNAPSSGSGHIITVDKELVTADSVNALATATAANKCIAHVGVMQAIDPRQNLHAIIRDTWDKASDWFITKEPTMTFVADSGNWKWDDVTTRVSAGAVNVNSNPKEPIDGGKEAIAAQFRDVETAVDPAWLGEAAGQHISTAVIRNKPMRSPWELGFIHRGIPFQTLNLLKAGSIDGTENISATTHAPVNFVDWNAMTGEFAKGTRYEYGDAGILDQIKMTPFNKSYGKVDITALKSTPANWIETGSSEAYSTLAMEILRSLFTGLKPHTAHEFVTKVDDMKAKSTIPADEDAAKKINITVTETQLNNVPATAALRSEAVDKLLNTLITGDVTNFPNDAAREEVVGKTVNLIEGRSASLPNTFKVLIAAQKIKDLEGNIGRLNTSNSVVLAADSLGAEASIGKFDAKINPKSAGGTKADRDESIYFDEIVGSSRMLVTVEKIHLMDGNETSGFAPRMKLRVRQIEYLD